MGLRIAVAGYVMTAMAIAVANPSLPAAAQEYCVACTGPDATYRCVIEQAVPTGMTLKMLCVGTLAREGGHDTCAIRGGTVFDCNGAIRRVDARAAASGLSRLPLGPSEGDAPQAPAKAVATPGSEGPPRSAPPPASELPAKPGSDQKARPASAAPEQTMEQVAKEMARSSGATVDKAAHAIGTAAGRTWRCVTTFFKSC